MIWGRTVIRNLVGWADASASIMARCAREAEHANLISLSNQEQSGLCYWRVRGPADHVKLSYKLYPRLFGIEFELAKDGNGWERFRAAVKARNAATHPSGIEDFLPTPVLHTIEELIAWFLGEDGRLLKQCADRIGFDLDELTAPEQERSRTPPNEVTPPDYEQIEQDASWSLELLRLMHLIVHVEVSYFLRWLNERLASTEDRAMIGFGWRTVARAICSLAEALQSATAGFLESAESRGEVRIPRAARRRIDKAKQSRPERLAGWLEAYSQIYGQGYRLDRAGSDWRCFRELWEIRDRITHPENAADLKIREGELDIVLGAVAWVAQEAGAALYLDADRWAELTTARE